MSRRAIRMLDVRSRQQWRKWLARHHASESEIWLIFYKRHTGVNSLTYDDALDEALCYGWIDSILRKMDDARYARKFTPRKPGSAWSTANRLRYADLARRGMLASAGVNRAPTNRNGDATRPSVAKLPEYIDKGLRANERAWRFFQSLAPSYRRAYIGWVDSAKLEETKARRLREAVRLLAAGRKLGLR